MRLRVNFATSGRTTLLHAALGIVKQQTYISHRHVDARASDKIRHRN